jgi:hypothetical protein
MSNQIRPFTFISHQVMDGIQEPKLKRIFLRFKQILQPSEDVNEKRIRRRKNMVQLLTRRLTLIKSVSSFLACKIQCSIPATRVALFAIGYLWMLVIPFPGLGRATYIDENALQPSQVCSANLVPYSLISCVFRSKPTGIGTMSILQISILLNWNKSVTPTSRVNS